MQSEKIPYYIFIAVFSGWIGFKAYQKTEIIGVIILIGTSTWLWYQFSSLEGIWNSLSFLTDPFLMFIISLFVGISYYTWKGEFFENSLMFGLGTAFIGAAVAMWLYKYWNMG